MILVKTQIEDKFLNMFDNYCIGNTEKFGDCLFTYNEVFEAARLLANNKAPGIDNISAEHLIYAADIDNISAEHLIYAADIDNISAEHLIYAADIMTQPLCELFNICIVHRFVPSLFTASIIISVEKDKMGANSFDSYRPISLVTMFSKVFECCLATRLDLNKNCDPMQFGSTREKRCQRALLTVDCVVNYSNSRGSPVHMAALDESKAFDRINHFSLFIALMKNNVLIPFLKVIIHWHLNLRGLVRWREQ